MNQTTTLTILPGDGIGPEVMDAALAILDVVANRFNLKFKLQKELIGGASLDVERFYSIYLDL